MHNNVKLSFKLNYNCIVYRKHGRAPVAIIDGHLSNSIFKFGWIDSSKID